MVLIYSLRTLSKQYSVSPFDTSSPPKTLSPSCTSVAVTTPLPQGFELFPGTQDDDREAASSEPAVYFGQCGWDGYSWGGRSRTYFRFSDSAR